ncbi:hypothetical protein BJX62DRAFT_53378 [Aspergillus germanicus]
MKVFSLTAWPNPEVLLRAEEQYITAFSNQRTRARQYHLLQPKHASFVFLTNHVSPMSSLNIVVSLQLSAAIWASNA